MSGGETHSGGLKTKFAMAWSKTRTEAEQDSKCRKREDTRSDIYEIVRLEKRVTIPVMSQEKVAVVSEFSGLGTLELKNDAMRNYRLLVANRVVKTKENVTFYILFNNFLDHLRQIQKKNYLEYVSPNPLAMVILPEQISNKMVSFLCIQGASETENKDNEVTM